MSAVGKYKLAKVMAPKKDPKPDEKVFELVDVEEYVNRLDEDEKRRFVRDMHTVIFITEDNKMITAMELPEDAPEDEIKQAEADGKIYEGHFKMDEQQLKAEGNDLFMHDAQKMLTGEEWVKITTDTEGEISLVFQVYTRQ